MIPIFGKQNAQYLVESSIAANALNKTFLIVGGAETGKTFFGHYFASLLLSFKVFNDADPDFFYFKGTLNSVELIERFSLAAFKKPFKAKRVVLFFDDLDLCLSANLNKILKVVEEPPAQTTIILSASSKESVLQTIVSRSFCINLFPPSLQDKIFILKNKGIINAEARLRYFSSIKDCVNKDFEILLKHRKSNLSFIKNTILATEKDFSRTLLAFDLANIQELALTSLVFSTEEEFKKLACDFVLNTTNFKSPFLSLFSFFNTARRDFKRAAEVFEV